MAAVVPTRLLEEMPDVRFLGGLTEKDVSRGLDKGVFESEAPIGIVMSVLGRNTRRIKPANHGKRPCNNTARRLKRLKALRRIKHRS